ncbi:hypothetical protein FBY34_4962 [Streptomyces sp. SLBN-115]|nr:hypothetical protein FBY34_4962 [Streptomyces sp. SLBN-115]
MIKMPYRPVRATRAVVAVTEAGFPRADDRIPVAEGAFERCRTHGRPGREGPGRGGGGVAVRQLRDARASFQVADGRMNAAAFAGSGW